MGVYISIGYFSHMGKGEWEMLENIIDPNKNYPMYKLLNYSAEASEYPEDANELIKEILDELKLSDYCQGIPKPEDYYKNKSWAYLGKVIENSKSDGFHKIILREIELQEKNSFKAVESYYYDRINTYIEYLKENISENNIKNSIVIWEFN